LGARGADEEFDDAVLAMRNDPTIELGCGHLIGERVVADMAVL
jgi:hypothetical protein